MTTKAARQAAIFAAIESHSIRSQTELAEFLAGKGISVSQGTLSKDLLDLGATRIRGTEGHLVYAVPGEGGDRSATAGESAIFDARLAKLCHELLVSADASANLVILRTPPGGAQYFASAMDKVSWPEVMGTIAGDDTVMVITSDATGGKPLADRLMRLAERDRAERPLA